MSDQGQNALVHRSISGRRNGFLAEKLTVRAAGTIRFGATATKAIMDEAFKREAEGALKEAEDGHF